jgi:hypothetical protein
LSPFNLSGTGVPVWMYRMHQLMKSLGQPGLIEIKNTRQVKDLKTITVKLKLAGLRKFRH